ncbi:hypothetical protein GCM10011495_37900 [Hymenobacter frigidus]|uniref:Uncharacterized protein n=1 Tax=Hymenobacter frigidus TaxID=1524095 RepID=A0ABQ2AIK6_9BACT|nr:hypothetical protein GCM10011495_37900 [Hymenobacter frigidus]
MSAAFGWGGKPLYRKNPSAPSTTRYTCAGGDPGHVRGVAEGNGKKEAGGVVAQGDAALGRAAPAPVRQGSAFRHHFHRGRCRALEHLVDRYRGHGVNHPGSALKRPVRDGPALENGGRARR